MTAESRMQPLVLENSDHSSDLKGQGTTVSPPAFASVIRGEEPGFRWRMLHSRGFGTVWRRKRHDERRGKGPPHKPPRALWGLWLPPHCQLEERICFYGEIGRIEIYTLSHNVCFREPYNTNQPSPVRARVKNKSDFVLSTWGPGE